MQIELKDTNIEKIYASGQCFTMFRKDDEYWCVGVDTYCMVKQLTENTCVLTCMNAYAKYWKNFFDVTTNYDIIRNMYMKKFPSAVTSVVVKNSYGLRMLNQDYVSCLLSFIISQRKSVPAIRKAVQKLILEYGNAVVVDPVEFSNTDLKVIHTFPSLEKLKSKVTMEALGNMGMGYRSVYLYDVITRGLVDEREFEGLEYSKAIKKLITMKGVGEKVANCTALYSLGYKNAYPRDVQILSFEALYCDGHFEDEKCGDYAGIIQLWQYYAMRCGGL